MALENGIHPFTAQALSNPVNTSYQHLAKQTPSPHAHHGSPSLFPDFSPTSFSPADGLYTPHETGNTDTDEDVKYSASDPRRLTPNLGISFVSQIHSLRKDLESRDALINSLEESLHQSRTEKAHLTGELDDQKAEVKSVKRQMQSLEDDMMQALEDIARERDKALESVSDSRRRLETAKKKIRTQEEDAIIAQAIWDKDRQEWEDKKRKLESQVHVVEERLKIMAAEMIATQKSKQELSAVDIEEDGGMPETWFVDGNGIRASSRLSNRSVDDHRSGRDARDFRSSRMSALHAVGGSKMSGLSLADELEMSEDGEDTNDFEGDFDAASPDALPEEKQIILMSNRCSDDVKARKIMGLQLEDNEQPFRDEQSGQRSGSGTDDYADRQPTISSTDTLPRCTPPSAATFTPERDAVLEKPFEQIEPMANQSRKRIAVPSTVFETDLSVKPSMQRSMVSTGCQTVEQGREESLTRIPADGILVPFSTDKNEMKSSSTQTIEDILVVPDPTGTRLTSSPMDIPVIAIHPPRSRPPSAHTSVVLPPRTKNAACQAAIEAPKNVKSTSMQTEEIRINRRPLHLPPRLQPSGLSTQIPARYSRKQTHISRVSASGFPERLAGDANKVGEGKTQPTRQSSKRAFSSSRTTATAEFKSVPTHSTIENARVGVNKDGSSINQQAFRPSKPIRSESASATLEHPNLDDRILLLDDLSDEESVDVAPIRKTLSKVQNSWRLVPQSKDSVLERLESASEEAEPPEFDGKKDGIERRDNEPPSTVSNSNRVQAAGKGETLSTTIPPETHQKDALSNGTAGHLPEKHRPSFPNLPSKESVAVAPPFPVPTRSSSRKLPVSTSDGAPSPTPYSTSFFTARHGQNQARPPVKRKILRKVQSAAAVSKPSVPNRPPPPPPIAMPSTVPLSPQTVPHSPNQFVLPYTSVAELTRPPTKASRPQSRATSAAIEAPSQQTSIVDAIAQTMVGEWMWKYVRKRTSFGISEAPQAEFEMGRNGEGGSNNGVRHKRWVWLAPYENAVIWSGKQPTSGPALLGKGGRKLTIQSVLDVKDDTPLPKNAGVQTAFDRSILILTPQRALKFTAVSRERHYIWLSALSFLSSATNGMNDLANPPPVPLQEHQMPQSQEPASQIHRGPIRDSIRLAKAKSRPSMGEHSFSSPTGDIEHTVLEQTTAAWGDNYSESEDAAEPPQVPRLSAQTRKRTSTGPRLVPLSAFHSYPANGLALASNSSLRLPTSRGKNDRHVPRSRSESGSATVHSTMTRRVTYDHPSTPALPESSFDPAGTVRMEAFIDRPDRASKAKPDRKEQEPRRHHHRGKESKRKEMGHWSADQVEKNVGIGGVRRTTEEEEDPFMGF